MERQYRLYDNRLSLDEVFITADSPMEAVKRIYARVHRDYTNRGNIIIKSPKGRIYKYFGHLRNATINTYIDNGVVHLNYSEGTPDLVVNTCGKCIEEKCAWYNMHDKYCERFR